MRTKALDLDYHPENEPFWLNRVGWEAFEQTIEIGFTPDRFSMLKLIGDQMPLAGKIIEAAFDAVDESAAAKIKDLAVEILNRSVKGTARNIGDEVKDAADVTQREIVVRNPGRKEWRAIEVVSRLKTQAGVRVPKALHRDLVAAMARETAKPAKGTDFFAKLAREGDTNDLRMFFAAAGYGCR